MALLGLVEKHGDGDFFREVGEWVLQRMMELEAGVQCGAERHERSPERVNQRNGYRERILETSFRTTNLETVRSRAPALLRSIAESSLCMKTSQA